MTQTAKPRGESGPPWWWEGGKRHGPTLRPASPKDASLTFNTCCFMSEGTTRIMTTPSAAHSTPKTPSPTATQRALALPPMSACAARVRGAQGLKETATEMIEAEAPASAR